MDYIIRPARLGEGEFLSELTLRSKAHWGHSDEYLEKCRPHLIVDSEYIENWPVRVLEKDLKIIGYTSLKVISDENRLDNLWIEPEYIRKGFGTILFNEAVEMAKESGWGYFRLAADERNINFYEKLGVRLIGKVQSRLGKDIFLPHMEYHLQ